jgi:hypothetical protein
MQSQMPPTQDASTYRHHLPDLTSPRFTSMQKQDAREYVAEFKQSGRPPWLHALYLHWMELFKEPYRGITSGGTRYLHLCHGGA